MTDYRNRLERLASGERPMSVYPIRAVDPADDMLEITVFDALQHAADLRKLLAEGNRMREALDVAERTLRAIADSDAWASPIATIKARDADDESLRDERVNMLLDAAAKAADVARQALGDTE